MEIKDLPEYNEEELASYLYLVGETQISPCPHCSSPDKFQFLGLTYSANLGAPENHFLSVRIICLKCWVFTDVPIAIP
jgi:hypothetical protein